MNRLLYSAWDGEPPRVHAISYALPGTPHLTLTGGSITNMPLYKYLNDLERDIHNQSGAYFAYVWGNYNSEDEADIYTLQTWQVCRPDDGTYLEATDTKPLKILLYIYQYNTCKY
jgi:hypothetical protein